MLFIYLFLFLLTGYCRADDCLSRDYDQGSIVCVCNSDYCDTVPRPEKVEQPQLLVYTSNKAGSRFEQTTGQFEQSKAADNQILINSELTTA
jgi:glucosylceramidase